MMSVNDAGSNVHCLCENSDAEQVRLKLAKLEGVQTVRIACPGQGARLIDTHLF